MNRPSASDWNFVRETLRKRGINIPSQPIFSDDNRAMYTLSLDSEKLKGKTPQQIYNDVLAANNLISNYLDATGRNNIGYDFYIEKDKNNRIFLRLVRSNKGKEHREVNVMKSLTALSSLNERRKQLQRLSTNDLENYLAQVTEKYLQWQGVLEGGIKKTPQVIMTMFTNVVPALYNSIKGKKAEDTDFYKATTYLNNAKQNLTYLKIYRRRMQKLLKAVNDGKMDEKTLNQLGNLFEKYTSTKLSMVANLSQATHIVGKHDISVGNVMYNLDIWMTILPVGGFEKLLASGTEKVVGKLVGEAFLKTKGGKLLSFLVEEGLVGAVAGTSTGVFHQLSEKSSIQNLLHAYNPEKTQKMLDNLHKKHMISDEIYENLTEKNEHIKTVLEKKAEISGKEIFKAAAELAVVNIALGGFVRGVKIGGGKFAETVVKTKKSLNAKKYLKKRLETGMVSLEKVEQHLEWFKRNLEDKLKTSGETYAVIRVTKRMLNWSEKLFSKVEKPAGFKEVFKEDLEREFGEGSGKVVHEVGKTKNHIFVVYEQEAEMRVKVIGLNNPKKSVDLSLEEFGKMPLTELNEKLNKSLDPVKNLFSKGAINSRLKSTVGEDFFKNGRVILAQTSLGEESVIQAAARIERKYKGHIKIYTYQDNRHTNMAIFIDSSGVSSDKVQADLTHHLNTASSNAQITYTSPQVLNSSVKKIMNYSSSYNVAMSNLYYTHNKPIRDMKKKIDASLKTANVPTSFRSQHLHALILPTDSSDNYTSYSQPTQTAAFSSPSRVNSYKFSLTFKYNNKPMAISLDNLPKMLGERTAGKIKNLFIQTLDKVATEHNVVLNVNESQDTFKISTTGLPMNEAEQGEVAHTIVAETLGRVNNTLDQAGAKLTGSEVTQDGEELPVEPKPPERLPATANQEHEAEQGRRLQERG